MAISFDKALGNIPGNLKLYGERSSLLASNLANADTPHFKAMDINFGEALAMASGAMPSGSLQRTDADHMGTPGGSGLSSQVL